MKQPRLAVAVSHPIQYYAPYYRALSACGGLHVRAFFASRLGLEKALDRDMGVELAWNSDLLAGYESYFLPNAERVKGTSFGEIDGPEIGKALADFAPDVVLLHGYAQKMILRALAWCRLNSVPALLTCDSSRRPPLIWPKRIVKHTLLPTLLKQFSSFLTVGDANERYLEGFGARREAMFRVPFIVDELFWDIRERRSETRRETRQRLGLVESDFVALYVGKLIERKRAGDLIDAAARLRSESRAPGLTLLFAGDGVERGALEAKAAASGVRCIFPGFVNIRELPSYYCGADALVHPADNEPFGLIAVEAAVLGLPLVLSDRVGAIGPTSIARPGENTLVYPCGDISALAAELYRLANEPETRARLSEASLRVSEELDYRKAVAGTLAAIDFCLGKHRLPLAA